MEGQCPRCLWRYGIPLVHRVDEDVAPPNKCQEVFVDGISEAKTVGFMKFGHDKVPPPSKSCYPSAC